MGYARNNRRRKAKATRKLARWRRPKVPFATTFLDAMRQLGLDLATSLNNMLAVRHERTEQESPLAGASCFT